jgi:hypothetical protein
VRVGFASLVAVYLSVDLQLELTHLMHFLTRRIAPLIDDSNFIYGVLGSKLAGQYSMQMMGQF